MTQVMPRYNRGMALRPINRIKHVIDAEGVITDTQSIVDLIITDDDPVIANINECMTGSKVNGIYLKVECTRLAGVGRANFYMAVYKNPSNSIIGPAANNVGASVRKKYVIHQEMIMLGDLDQNSPRVMFNGVVKIPKGYIRNGPNDRLQLLLIAGTTAQTADFCVQSHYKEFR